MAQQDRDFWPPLGQTRITPPVVILREQAALLANKSQGLIEGQVDTSAGGDRFYHRLYVVAPTLDNYRYQLLGVYHAILLYPVYVIASGESKTERPLDSEEEFLNWLREVLSSDRTKQVLDALLAQIGG
jgi:hypothetical protein